MNFERRAIPVSGQFQTRADGEDLYIEGYFAVFGSKYWLWDDAYETIEPGAFDGQTGGDVRALVNHDTTLVLGRTTAGTLSLRQDEIGLFGTIRINRADQDAMNLYERVKRGDVDQCSFGFDILEHDVEITDGEPTVWRIRKVKLYEVSCVTFPAYEDTSIQARKREVEDIKKRKIESWREKAKSRMKGE